MRALYFILGLAVATTLFLIGTPVVVCGNLLKAPLPLVPTWRTSEPAGDNDIRIILKPDSCPVIISTRTHSGINNHLVCKRT